MDYPHLRIIDQLTWNAAQTRIQAAADKYEKGNKARALLRKTRYPLSGLLRCGACGAPIVVISGSSARYYRCGDFHKRRTCEVSSSLREDQISAAITDVIRKQLEAPQSIAFLAETLKRRSKEQVKSAQTEQAPTEKALVETEERISRLVETVASGALGPLGAAPIRDALEKEEATRRALEAMPIS